MIVRKYRRIEVRLDEERGRFLEEEISRRGTTLAAWLRQKVDEEHARAERERRLAAAERMFALNLDLPENPEELNQLLEEAHCPEGCGSGICGTSS